MLWKNYQIFTEALFRLCYCPPLRLILRRRDTVWCAGIEQPQAQFALVQRETLIDIRSRQIQCLCRSWCALCINVHNIGRHTYVIVYIRKYYLTHLQPISLNHSLFLEPWPPYPQIVICGLYGFSTKCHLRISTVIKAKGVSLFAVYSIIRSYMYMIIHLRPVIQFRRFKN